MDGEEPSEGFFEGEDPRLRGGSPDGGWFFDINTPFTRTQLVYTQYLLSLTVCAHHVNTTTGAGVLLTWWGRGA